MQATVHGVAKSRTRLNNFTHSLTHGIMSQFLQMSQVIATSLAFERVSVLFLFYNKLFTGPNRDSFPSGSAVKNLPAVQETRVSSLGAEDPLKKVMPTRSSILP